jgi:RNA-binding protein
MPTTLKANQIRHLRSLSHALKPVIMVGGKGITPNLITELELALSHHELVKVQIAIDDRTERAATAASLAEQTRAHIVQTIGKVLCLYRANDKKQKIELPK